jgi:hypothetical protein
LVDAQINEINCGEIKLCEHKGNGDALRSAAPFRASGRRYSREACGAARMAEPLGDTNLQNHRLVIARRRSRRSNPESTAGILDCFAPLAHDNCLTVPRVASTGWMAHDLKS